MKADVGEVGI